MTAGTYGGGTFGWLWGGGAGLYVDNYGRIYPQLYGGTPRVGLSAGYTPDLEGLLTGTSVSGSPGRGSVRFNTGTSGGAVGVGVGTPGIGVTYGFGPLDMSHDFSRPWSTSYIRDSAAAGGVPSRSNVWEYGFPDSASIPGTSGAAAAVTKSPQQIADFLNKYIFGRSMGAQDEIYHGRAGRANLNASVFTAGAPPIPFFSGAQSGSGGLPGLMTAAGAIDPFTPDQPTPSGLLGLIRENMRNNYSSGQ